MDRKIFIENYDKYISEGKQLIEELDKVQFPVKSALWFYYSDSDSWKLLIASPNLEGEGPIKVYKYIQQILEKMELKYLTLNDISVIALLHSLIQLLSSAVSTGEKSISGIRFTANTINNTYIEDAFIYRLSK